MAFSLSLDARADIDRQVFARAVPAIVRIQVVNAAGVFSVGSGVVIAPEKVATNCHVTRGASEIMVTALGTQHSVKLVSQDVEHDLCVLVVKGLDAQAATLGKSLDLKLGQPVVAMGYPGVGRLLFRDGRVAGLHNYHGANVIQNSALFVRGESGGGLFNERGELVGILTFKAPAGGDFHFALPVEWLERVVSKEAVASTDPEGKLAFWERPDDRSAFFLRAATLESLQLWEELLAHALGWSAAEGGSAQPWVAIGKAHAALKRAAEALAAFRRAVAIDPLHGEAWYRLGLILSEAGDRATAKEVADVLRQLNPEWAAEITERLGGCTIEC